MTERERERQLSLASLLVSVLIPLNQGLALMPTFNHNQLLVDPSPNIVTPGIRASTHEFVGGEDTTQSIAFP